MKKLFSKEVIIALTVILAMVLLFVGIEFLKGVNVFKEANYYYVSYENVTGLAQSAPVTANGFKVGQVREIQYEYDNPGHVLVEISLDKQFRVPEGTVAILTSDILGTATISLDMPKTDKYISVGDHIPGAVPTGMMDQISSDLMPAAANILPKIDTLLTNVNLLVANQSLTNSINRLDDITLNLERTTRSLNALVASLPPVVNNVTSITNNVDTITSDLTHLSANLKNMPLDSLVNELQGTLANLHKLSDQLNSPNSTLGMLMNDPALYKNLNTTVQSLDSLFIDIKKNPKRYISIKLL